MLLLLNLAGKKITARTECQNNDILVEIKQIFQSSVLIVAELIIIYYICSKTCSPLGDEIMSLKFCFSRKIV